MNNFITNELFSDFLLCKYKFYLKINGEVGIKSEFSKIEEIISDKYNNKVRDHLKNKNISSKTISNSSIISFVEKPFDIGLNIKLKISKFSVVLDAILTDKMVSYKYIPVKFISKEKIEKNDKLLLSLYAHVLAKATTTLYPLNGIFIFGHKMNQKKVKLDNINQETISILKELTFLFENKKSPPFFLNKHCNACEFRNSCFSFAKEKDDLSLLSGLREGRIKKLHSKGIFTLNQFSYTFRPKRLKNKSSNTYLPELKALAIRDNKVYIHKIPEIPNSDVQVFWDIEGLPNESYYYLIGILIDKCGRLTKYSFWADNRNDQDPIIKKFIEKMKSYPNSVVFHYGNYEKRFLKYIIKYISKELKKECEDILKRSHNVLSYFSTGIYVPTYSDGLKDIANYLGFRWSESDASGIQSIVWRKKWELYCDQKLKSKIIQYNIEDCLALKWVKEWLCKLRMELNLDKSMNQFKMVNEIPNENIKKWGKPNYQIDDFKMIHNVAYFDYQRTKVHFRTNKIIKATIKKEIAEKQKLNKIDKIVSVSPTKCLKCEFYNFLEIKRYSKIIIDLKFTNASIKRSVIEYKGGRFKCHKCGKIIVPKKLNRIPTYGENLVSWSINQHITYRVGLNKVAKMLSEYFKIGVSIPTIYQFKSRIVKRYSQVASELMEKLINGPFISADETDIKVRKFTSAYVWVFSNLDTVLYVFRANREGQFLKDLFVHYKGVIISDFYSAYDSLQCPQQKCLVHLIRDLNGDLINNQLDEEFKEIVLSFGKIMRNIVEKIDKYGLRKRNLYMFKKVTEKFLTDTYTKKYNSEIALKYQKRFKKYGDKLFTFLEHDGIPWNNNIAEHAIKPLAKYRRENQGVFTENSINNYLLLLSIQQTCTLRGISFFEFLRSRCQSLCNFS